MEEKITKTVEEFENSGSSILGTYEGECADSNITNLNGLDITREVWEHVFESDEYKTAIEHGWLIGFLGHPAEADCQDFQKACIVMKDGYIADNGKVYGKFDLIDTPVGRIVKAFQDAGVVFGISVRGAGDIIQNSVDPETFVFRGFDLVAFPAFPESIPTFTAIAASTDMEQRRKYQAVCAAVNSNIESLDTVESVNIVQSCFAKQSDEYQKLEARKAAILGEDVDEEEIKDEITEKVVDESDPRIQSMVMLYLDAKKELEDLRKENYELKEQVKAERIESTKKVNSIQRIFNSQINDLNSNLEKVESSLQVKTQEAETLKSELNSSVDAVAKENEDLKSQLKAVTASCTRYKASNQSLRNNVKELSEKLNKAKEDNLKYNEKVEAAQSTIVNMKSIVSSSRVELDETVRKLNQEKQNTSNRDGKIENMAKRLQAVEASLKEYQDAYSQLYAHALGIRSPKVSVTANTDVNSLQKMIRAGTSIMVKPEILEYDQEEDTSDFDVVDYDDDGLVTL